MDNIEVSIIIVNYNTCELTTQCIESIIAKTVGISYEIIVVDNASKEIKCIEELSKEKHFLLIKAGENLGFGRANNLGVRYAKGKYILFLNSDTILNNNAIYMLHKFYVNNKEKMHLGVIGCYLNNAYKELGQSSVTFPKCYSPIVRVSNKILKCLHLTEKSVFDECVERKVDGIIGADMFMDIAVFKEIGGFDDMFFLYGEEVELQKRISNNGYNQYLISGPEITHLEGGSNNRKRHMSFFTIYCLLVGGIIYSRKHFSFFERLFYNFTNVIVILIWTIFTIRLTCKEKKLIIQLMCNSNNQRLYNISKLI